MRTISEVRKDFIAVRAAMVRKWKHVAELAKIWAEKPSEESWANLRQMWRGRCAMCEFVSTFSDESPGSCKKCPWRFTVTKCANVHRWLDAQHNPEEVQDYVLKKILPTIRGYQFTNAAIKRLLEGSK